MDLVKLCNAFKPIQYLVVVIPNDFLNSARDRLKKQELKPCKSFLRMRTDVLSVQIEEIVCIYCGNQVESILRNLFNNGNIHEVQNACKCWTNLRRVDPYVCLSFHFPKITFLYMRCFLVLTDRACNGPAGPDRQFTK